MTDHDDFKPVPGFAMIPPGVLDQIRAQKAARVCGAEKPVKGGALTFRCDLPMGHAGKHEDNSMRPVLHAAWDEGAA